MVYCYGISSEMGSLRSKYTTHFFVNMIQASQCFNRFFFCVECASLIKSRQIDHLKYLVMIYGYVIFQTNFFRRMSLDEISKKTTNRAAVLGLY